MTTLQLRKSSSWSPLRRGLLLIILVLGCFGLSPAARAVDPPPDGGYPNQNTAEGEDALFSLTGASSNTAVGFHALYTDMGGFNTAVGSNALVANRGGFYNTAVGADTLLNSTEAGNNTAVGCYALLGGSGSVGPDNVAVGFRAMYDGRGFSCTAVGANALASNSGELNTAVGEEALTANTTGRNNTATGWRCLFNNTTGLGNTASGLQAMFVNRSGSSNVALGVFALGNNIVGSNNIALGTDAGMNLATGDDNIYLSNSGRPDESGAIRIGTQGTQTATFIAGVSGAGVMGPAVKVNAAGQIGTALSSARFRQNIKPMAAEAN